MADSLDITFIKQAIDISRQAKPSSTHFSVGAVLVDQNRAFVASGFTQELGEGVHAEAVAIKKAIDAGFNLKGATLYSSMEPCSIRASGKNDCSALLIEKGIARVVFALCEPPTFVICKGKNKLKAAGIRVEQINKLKKAVIEINRHILSPAKNHKPTLLACICCLFAYHAFTLNPALAGDPQLGDANADTTVSQKYKEQVTERFSSVVNQINKFSGQFLPSEGRHNHSSTSSPSSSQQASDTNAVRVQIGKTMDLFKGMIYDPANPGPFFNSLIAFQSTCLSAQNQVIAWGEKFLGFENGLVLRMKENNRRTAKYIEALKQQKVLLEQSAHGQR